MNFRPSRYVQYKEATQVFISWLRSSLPDFGESVKLTANAIRERAEAVSAAGRPVPPNVMHSLQAAINLGEEVTKKYTKSDEGHSFFLEMLKDVRALLFPLATTEKVKAKSGKSKGKRKEKNEEKNDPKTDDAWINKFAVLSVDVDVKAAVPADLELEAEKEEVRAVQERLGSESPEALEIDFEDDTMWFAVQCFLYEATELMYNAIEAWHDFKDGKVPIFVPTAATNLATMLIAKAANRLMLDYPFLISWEKLSALLYFEDFLRTIMRKAPHLDEEESSYAGTVAVKRKSLRTRRLWN
ncbi:hypothetical protein HDU96_007535 [Phlyctochytrium bullatum]|nr:hypothetical protein HDU96_007535 [Phlyctochytrium bullatum]